MTSSLLEYFWLVLPSVEQRDGILCDVVVALRHASTGDEISGEEEPGQQFTIGEKCIKAAATFCMARIRAYIDEVDVAITEARKSGKAHRSEQSVIVMMERSGTRTARTVASHAVSVAHPVAPSRLCADIASCGCSQSRLLEQPHHSSVVVYVLKRAVRRGPTIAGQVPQNDHSSDQTRQCNAQCIASRAYSTRQIHTHLSGFCLRCVS